MTPADEGIAAARAEARAAVKAIESNLFNPPPAHTKHTPGPWKIGFRNGDGKTNGAYITREGGTSGVIVRGGGGNGVRKEADARLIAAAPELLVACRMLAEVADQFQAGRRDGGTMGLISSAMDQARAAIAKAEGR